MFDSNHIILPYDFSEAMALTAEERIDRAIRRVREHDDWEDPLQWQSDDFIQAPPTGSESEIRELENSLGAELPTDYRLFIARHRFLSVGDGLEIGGLDAGTVSHDGERLPMSVVPSPWRVEMDSAVPADRYIAIGQLWQYADGDQLLLDLQSDEKGVYAYLHDPPPNPVGAPLIEFYAPSVSLAIWRMVDEWCEFQDEDEE